MNEQKVIKIERKEYIQNELTLEQVEALTDLLNAEIDLSSGKEITVKDIISILTKKKVIGKAIGILLIEKGKKFDAETIQSMDGEFRKLPMSVVSEVMTDFFGLNKNWISSLGSCFKSMMTTVTEKKTNI